MSEPPRRAVDPDVTASVARALSAKGMPVLVASPRTLDAFVHARAERTRTLELCETARITATRSRFLRWQASHSRHASGMRPVWLIE